MEAHEDNARRLASQIGQVTGEQEMVDDVLSGRMPSDFIAPMLAGMIDSAVRGAFAPVVGVRSWNDFEPDERPMVGEITLLDGSRLRITIDALPPA